MMDNDVLDQARREALEAALAGAILDAAAVARVEFAHQLGAAVQLSMAPAFGSLVEVLRSGHECTLGIQEATAGVVQTLTAMVELARTNEARMAEFAARLIAIEDGLAQLKPRPLCVV